VRRTGEHLVTVRRGQVGGELADPGQVDPPVGEHLQEHRMLARGPSGGDPQVGFVLREVQDLRAVDEHRIASLASVELPLVHLADVRHELPLHPSGLRKQPVQPAKQLVIRQRPEMIGGLRYNPHNQPPRSDQ